MAAASTSFTCWVKGGRQGVWDKQSVMRCEGGTLTHFQVFPHITAFIPSLLSSFNLNPYLRPLCSSPAASLARSPPLSPHLLPSRQAVDVGVCPTTFIAPHYPFPPLSLHPISYTHSSFHHLPLPPTPVPSPSALLTGRGCSSVSRTQAPDQSPSGTPQWRPWSGGESPHQPDGQCGGVEGAVVKNHTALQHMIHHIAICPFQLLNEIHGGGGGGGSPLQHAFIPGAAPHFTTPPHTFCSAAIFPSYSLTSFSKPRSTSSSRVIHLL